MGENDISMKLLIQLRFNDIYCFCDEEHNFNFFRDLDDSTSLDESVENLDRGSLASFGSGNTTDSDKVRS